jgi:hypothetical protein
MSQIDEPKQVHHGSRRQIFEISWVVGVVAFTFLRLLVAQETLVQYGLNIWVFGFIDLITAVPYAVGVARVVEAMVDRDAKGASGWLLVAGFSFVAPYAYVALAGTDASFPVGVWVLLVVVMVVFGANAIWNGLRKVRRARSDAQGAAAIAAADPESQLAAN